MDIATAIAKGTKELDETLVLYLQQRQIGALEFKLKVIRVMQNAGYDARVINTILNISTTE